MDLSTGSLLLPWWAALAFAVAAVTLAVLAVLRGGWLRTVGTLAQSLALLGGLFLAWNYFDRMNTRELAEERREFERRLADLNARALSPGSPLPCLDALAGEAVEEACEKALFANAEGVGAAVAYTSTRVALLRDAISLAAHDAGFDEPIAELRRVLERDRFGFVAQALSARDGCTADGCEALALFSNADRIQANLKERTFDIHVGRHVAGWTKPAAPAAPVAATQPNMQTAASQPAAPASNVNFPSASSIPPVSIMTNEPGMTGQTGVESDDKPVSTGATANARDAKPAPAPRRATPQPSPRSPALRAGNAPAAQ